MRTRILVFVSVVQSLLFIGHLFVYATCVFFWQPSRPSALETLRIGFAVLSVSFVCATLLAFRTYNFLVRLFYTLAAAWIGILNFLLQAAFLCWIVYALVAIFRLPVSSDTIADVLFGLALLTSLYGIVNAACPRVTRIRVRLPGLPESWRGRVAALVCDTHLGHVRGRHFLSRIVNRLQRLRPDVVFFPGDMFDGTQANPMRLAEPWKPLAAATPLGIYFVTGNHEEFGHIDEFVRAVQCSGLRVLRNEKVDVDGLQILGINNRDSHDPRFSAILDQLALDPARASILLLHMPTSLALSEAHGISLQLSGHTHGGQIFPSTLVTARIFGAYRYGLHAFGKMMVYTSCGVGTWGPPLRVGTQPEIVLVRFD